MSTRRTETRLDVTKLKARLEGYAHRVAAIQAEAARIRQELSRLRPIGGTLQREKRPCAEGHCKRGWHWAYRWRFRKDGKLFSKHVSLSDLASLKQWIADARRARLLMRQLRALESQKARLLKPLAAFVAIISSPVATRRPDGATLDELRRARAKGMSFRALAAKYGYPKSSLHLWLKG